MLTGSGLSSSAIAADADLCSAVLGPELTAYLADADTVGDLRSRLTGTDDEARRPTAARLEVACSVILTFRAANRVAMTQPWLREVGAAGDHTPARLIRAKGDDEGTAHLVLHAAREWLARPSVPAS